MKKAMFILMVVGLLSSIGFAAKKLSEEKIDSEAAVEYQRVRDLRYDIASLYGVKGVEVIVEDLYEDEKEFGFNMETIKTKVELKLRLAGIRVLTEKERGAMPDGPFLYINVNVVKVPASTSCAIGYTIKFKQMVELKRWSPHPYIYGATWGTGSTTVITGKSDIDKEYDTIEDMTDKFINAYLTANPKK